MQTTAAKQVPVVGLRARPSNTASRWKAQATRLRQRLYLRVFHAVADREPRSRAIDDLAYEPTALVNVQHLASAVFLRPIAHDVAPDQGKSIRAFPPEHRVRLSAGRWAPKRRTGVQHEVIAHDLKNSRLGSQRQPGKMGLIAELSTERGRGLCNRGCSARCRCGARRRRSRGSSGGLRLLYELVLD